MKVFVEDLKNNIKIEMPKCDIKLINVGHSLSVKYLDENNNVKVIEGVIYKIKHEFSLEYNQIIHIQIS